MKDIPKSVAFLKLLKLHSNNTGKCGTNESSMHWGFWYSTREQINVVYMSANDFANYQLFHIELINSLLIYLFISVDNEFGCFS